MELEQTASADSAATADTSASLADHTAATLDQTQVEQAPPVDENAELLSLLPADDGMEEIEHEGIRAKVPKELKEAFLRQQDYTRKTQEVAEQRRQTEAQAAALQQQAEFQRQHITEVATLVSIDKSLGQIDAQLAEYKKVDWAGLYAQDPQKWVQYDGAMRQLERQKGELQGEKAQLAQSLTQKHQRQALEQQQATARRIQESQRELERDIKGWSPELGSKLTEYGKKQGFPAEVLANVTQPAFVKLLHKAYQLDQLIAQRTAKAPAPPAAPVTRVGAKASTAVIDQDKLPTDQWLKWREDQIAAQRKKR